jgi:hypothetical protein
MGGGLIYRGYNEKEYLIVARTRGKAVLPIPFTRDHKIGPAGAANSGTICSTQIMMFGGLYE